jgi:hypothetical protein
MKKVASAALLGAVILSPAYAVEITSLKDKDVGIDFGIQYRVMYNNSNIQSNNQYDFFRQRLRLNFDVKTQAGVGGFFQLEYRGGWGGSSPAFSDPRDAYAVNAFNRLQARGVRYGYLYFPAGPGTVLAGILPANDQVDQMLFSADWDLNVGGIAYAGKVGDFDYRLAYVRLVDGAFYRNKAVKDKDQHFFVLDLNSKFGGVYAGIHYYGTYGKLVNPNRKNCVDPDHPSDPNYYTDKCNPGYILIYPTENPTAYTLNQTWIGPTLTYKLDQVNLHAAVLANSGKVGDTSNSGWLARLEGSTKLGPATLSLLGVYSTGKDNKKGFQTVHSLLGLKEPGKGTGGYWAYTYIFTPHGPSDVNDFRLEPGNLGYGLTTVQAKVDFPITEGLSAQGVVGTFRSNKDMGGNGKSLGTEAGVTLAASVGKHMTLEFGGAVASLGNAGRAMYNQPDPNNPVVTKKSVNEIFSRLQLEF